jgi:hypothetical protein
MELGDVVLLLSLVPLAFLAYTLINLRSLNITIAHPRVIVEFSLSPAFLAAGVYLKLKK